MQAIHTIRAIAKQGDAFTVATIARKNGLSLAEALFLITGRLVVRS